MRTDASAAQSMAQRQGIGRERHLDASMLWIQEKVRGRIIEVCAIQTSVNSADLGMKVLSMSGPAHLLNVVEEDGWPIGENQHEEISLRSHADRLAQQVDDRCDVAKKQLIAIISVLSMLTSANGDVMDMSGSG